MRNKDHSKKCDSEDKKTDTDCCTSSMLDLSKVEGTFTGMKNLLSKKKGRINTGSYLYVERLYKEILPHKRHNILYGQLQTD